MTIDDLEFDCEALHAGPLREDVEHVLQRRSAQVRYSWLAARSRAMAEEMRELELRPPEYHDAQKALLEAAGRFQDAANRIEEVTNG